MKIAIIGVGKMGSQIARKLAQEGIHVGVLNNHPEPAQALASEQDNIDFVESNSKLGEFFGDDQAVVWIMVPHLAVPAVAGEVFENVQSGSIVIDGGNSRYSETILQAEKAREKGIEFVDVGTSGGVHGFTEGFSMMVGGTQESIDTIKPILAILADPRGGYAHIGDTGSGHYVKMIHNGVEYGIMQAYAEGYHLLKEGPLKDIDLAQVADVWQQGSINESFLNGLSANMLKEDQEFGQVEGIVAESGEARWTLETAKEASIDTPVIQASFDVRLRSQKGEITYATKFLARLRNMFGGHSINVKKD